MPIGDGISYGMLRITANQGLDGVYVDADIIPPSKTIFRQVYEKITWKVIMVMLTLIIYLFVYFDCYDGIDIRPLCSAIGKFLYSIVVEWF